MSFLTPSCNEGYEDSELTGRVENLENKVQKLEEQMNSNISSLQSIIEAVQNNDYITSVTPLMEDGTEIGYTIFFKKGNPIQSIMVKTAMMDKTENLVRMVRMDDTLKSG